MAELKHGDGLHLAPEIVQRLLDARDIGEIKVVLLVADLTGPYQRPVGERELMTSNAIRALTGMEGAEPGEQRVAAALSRALVNGALLRVTLSGVSGAEQHYLLPTARGHEHIERLRKGDVDATVMEVPPDTMVTVFRPNVFAFYEQHLGSLTPMLAEQLRDAERSYPRVWIEEAIRVATDANVKNWRYIETVLTRWEESGPPAHLAQEANGR